MEQLHQEGKDHKAASDYEKGVALDPCFHFGCHEREVFGSLDEKEIHNGCETYSPEQSDFPFEFAPVVEGEYRSRNKLHDGSECERDRYRQENSKNYGESFLGVEQFVETEVYSAGHLDECNDKGGTQKLENHRDRCRCRHSERVEYVEQNYVGHHHRHEDADQIVEREMFRSENAVPGNLHHAVAHGCADEHTDRGDYQHALESGCSRTDCGVQEVDRIIADSDREVEYGQQE